MYWDGLRTPCVETPVGDFFGRRELFAAILERITLAVDPLRQRPDTTHQTYPDGIVKNGTRITLHWPNSALLNTDRRQGTFFTTR